MAIGQCWSHRATLEFAAVTGGHPLPRTLLNTRCGDAPDLQSVLKCVGHLLGEFHLA